MKTTERVEQALKRIKELLILVTEWTKNTKEKDALTEEFKEKKLQMIEDLYKQLGQLNDRFMFTHESEFKTKEYVVEYEKIKTQINDLKK